MTHLIDDYLREVETSLRVDAARRRQIVDELRTHLIEKVDDLQATDTMRPREDIEQEVLREFGNPRDLALAYEPEGTVVLTNQAGDIVLRLGKAVGRGAAAVGRGSAKALKWVAISLAAVLILAMGVGAWAYYEVKPYIPAIIEQSDTAYEYRESCVSPCNGSAPADAFYVSPEAKTVRLDLTVHSLRDPDAPRRVANGSVSVIVTDPHGEVRYDRMHALTTDGGRAFETSWSAVPGNWTVKYEFVDFVGSVRVEAYAMTFPWGSDAR